MFQKIFRAKSLQRFACVLLVAIMLISLFPVSSFASEVAGTIPLAAPIASGHVGPNASFAPWTLYDDGTVLVGGGTVRGIGNAWLTEAIISPWNSYRNDVKRIVFTEPVAGAGNLSGLFANLPLLYAIDNLGYLNIPDNAAEPQVWMANMFRGPNLLTSLDVADWDVSNVTRFRSMFRDAHYLETIIGIDGWDTSSLHTMNSVFRDARSLTSLDLSNWNTSLVTGADGNGMESAFRGMTSLKSLNLEGWDTSNSALLPAGMRQMFLDTPLRELTLGPDWEPKSAPGHLPNLPEPPNNATYTGMWINVGSGTIYAPEGSHTFTSAQLMDNTSDPYRADTWIWQRRYPLLLVTFTSAGNGTVTPPSVGVEPNETIDPALAIYPKPNTGFQFLHWTSSDPAHTGGPFQTSGLYDLYITQDTTFTAYFTPIPPDTHLVTFLLNGGYVDGYPDPRMVTVANGSAITTANVPIPTRPNYGFLGWRESGTGPLLSGATVGALAVTEPRTFVAYWEPNLLERQLYLIGTEDGFIRPSANITRAEVATIFFRLITDQARTAYWRQTNPYSDVEPQSWFNNAISTMTNAGVFKGFPDGSFAPNQTITRAEMAAAIVRFVEEMDGMNLLEMHFADISGHWAANYINMAAVNGWVQGPRGLGDAFYPDRPLTRAEAAAMINRVSDRLQERTQDLLPNMQTWPDNADVDAWYYFYIQSVTNSYTFRWRGTNDAFEQWVTLIPARDWAVLERPESDPEDIFRS
ncbi:MAG: S-layer homology domain-containing protein [Oscillospiraceae bacterium]|nr:S-layer homology domain-containing protein [Oscillospiraceae bacterium]